MGIFACATDLPDEILSEYDRLPETLDFNVDIKPILSDKCFACHGPDQNKLEADLRLDIEQIAKSAGATKSGRPAIFEGSLGSSELFHRIVSSESDHMMPPPESNLKLNHKEKAMLIKWIESGAEYQDHWAFTPIHKESIPAAEEAEHSNEIDRIIHDALTGAGLDFNPESDRSLLLRRLSFDLIGLPPTHEEIEKFLQDLEPNAYERQVRRLLASPHFGERMAVDWMDVARFADTHGYQSDRFRDMSPWRDWVIQSFNDNLRYDDFITWQLAGDLLPEPTKEQRLATAFLRLHPQNEEGGIVEEEFKAEYVSDRVNTVGTAFMGMTIACAKCHDHKYDPISQKEYYEFYSFFNNVNEAGQISFNGAMPVPTMLLTDEKADSIISFIQSEIAERENQFAITKKSAQSEFQSWLDGEAYQKIAFDYSQFKPIAHFTLDKHLHNRLNKNEIGEMKRTASNNELPTFIDGKLNQGLVLDGDAWLDLNGIGNFKRYDPFTVSLWVNIPESITDGVIFHKGSGAALFNFKGFHIALKNNQLELLMAAVAPYNAIIEHMTDPIPRGEWIHLSLRYDGRNSADGFSIFVNGVEKETTIEIDNLYKDITVFDGQKPVGLQFGARWRGKGIGGASIDDIHVFNTSIPTIKILELANKEKWNELISKQRTQVSAFDISLLKEYYFASQDTYQNQDTEILQLYRSVSDSIEDIKEVMVMEEMPEPRETFILERGQYDSPAEQVFPNTPHAILPFGEYPKNRLGLAEWLTDPQHPLTARVAVNRYWQLLFGEGLVKTAEDFGNQGTLPRNKELLDWLAADFRDNQWDVKALLTKIVMSQTYRQSSLPSQKAEEIDPANRLFSRGPSKRLNAEMLRDNMLLASELLNETIGGPSVFPYQPDGLWGMLSGGKYPQITEEDKYRRSLYTFWKRTVPHPTQATFDAPERSECIVRRQETNTPLQALALMNDQVYMEAARKMAAEIANGSSMESTFMKLTGRSPSEKEFQLLEDMYLKELDKFVEYPEKITAWLADNRSKVENDASLASYAVVISTIMNTDACITKR